MFLSLSPSSALAFPSHFSADRCLSTADVMCFSRLVRLVAVIEGFPLRAGQSSALGTSGRSLWTCALPCACPVSAWNAVFTPLPWGQLRLPLSLPQVQWASARARVVVSPSLSYLPQMPQQPRRGTLATITSELSQDTP